MLFPNVSPVVSSVVLAVIGTLIVPLSALAGGAEPLETTVEIGEPSVDDLPENFAGPKVVVPAPMRGSMMVPPAHRPLVAALRKRFGPRVIEVKDVLAAQAKTEITASDLKAPPPLSSSTADAARTGPPPPPALARLGEALGAGRAILVDIKDRVTTVLVYPGLDGMPAVVVKVPRKKADALNKKWANAVAAAVEKYAAGALAEPAQDFEIGEVMAEEEAPSDVRAEIEAEEARERARREALAAIQKAEEEASGPLVTALLGAGGALRLVETSGGLAPALAPVEHGVVPTASLLLTAAPLRAIPSLRTAPWADALVELSWRHGFATVVDPKAGPGAEPCPYDDDDLQVRASWRLLLADPDTPAGAWLPRLGLGAGGGLERVELGCTLPVVSTSYPHADAFVRITQPLVARSPHGPASLVELDVVVGPRAVIATGLPTGSTEGELATTLHPSWSLDAFVQARPLPSLPFLVARAGSRVTGTHFDNSAGLLVVDDTRVSFELQLGGSL